MAEDPGHTASAAEASVEERQFQTEVKQVLQILIHSLYTDREVFLRELISNASDALDKVRFRSLTDRKIVDPDAELAISIDVNKSAKTLAIRDTGIGMARDEVNANIGTIAHSGSADFIRRLSESKDEGDKLKLIGQFGVGFYSVFMVAERVVVTTRSADLEAEAVVWESTGDGTYTIASHKEKKDRGTEIKIYVRSDCEEYLDAHRLEGIVRRHSDYVSYPIKVAGKQANAASALWARPRSEVTKEQYTEFYQHVTGDHREPLAWEHVSVDVPIQFYAILYVPREARLELLFAPEPKVALNLHVRRVFIQDDCQGLLPLYLRFIRGVVDCDDLPLNVARESLQNNPVLAKIRSTLTRRVLSLLTAMSKDRSTDYLGFWESFGMVLKEGVARDFEHKQEIAKLLLYRSSLAASTAVGEGEEPTPDAAGYVSLQTYVDRLQSGQETIYYLTAESREAAAQSPLLEPFRKRRLEVLYMTDPVDEWVVNALQDFDGRKFQAIDAEDVKLEEEPRIEGVTEDRERTVELVSYLKKELAERVVDVRESHRLTDSPCVLVTPKGGLSQQMERLLKMTDQEFEPTKRILEINPRHPAIANMGELLRRDRASVQLKEWAGFLVDYVLLAEGKVEDPQRVAGIIQGLMRAASEHALGAAGGKA
ncbi:MAG: molecular chaperone HtpG [Gemmatimonadota bacterium]